MPGNRYHRIGNLATHPAFRGAALVCPLCGSAYDRVSGYNRDFLGHDPDARAAWRWLSGREYERQAPKRDWPPFDEMLAMYGDDTVRG